MKVTRMHKCIMKHQTTGNCAVECNKVRCTCKGAFIPKITEDEEHLALCLYHFSFRSRTNTWCFSDRASWIDYIFTLRCQNLLL